MKWRFPAEVWPATPVRKPCSPSSAWMSRGRLGDPRGRHADVLDDQRGSRAGAAGRSARAAPRARVQSTSIRLGSRVKSGVADQLVRRRGSPRPRRPGASSSASSSAPNSTSSAADSGGSSIQSWGAPAMFWRRPSAPGRPSARPRSRRRRPAPGPARSPTRSRRSGARRPSSGPAAGRSRRRPRR